MPWDYKKIAFTVGLLLAVLFYQGVVPFIAIPTLGQVLWLGGFAESFARQGVFSTHSIFIGYPSGAPVAFGLAGAWPMGILVRMGFSMADAYAWVCVFWLTLAYAGAVRLARLYAPSIYLAAPAAALWLVMPMIWQHASYSMLSMAIAMLPFYFLVGYGLLTAIARPLWQRIGLGVTFVLTAQVSVFMDGYTFVMFFLGMTLLGVMFFLSQPASRRYLLLYAAPLVLLGFGLGYLAYTHNVGGGAFEASPLDFFRGWGLDLTFAVLPSQGLSAVADFLGFSVVRTVATYWGDSSVWNTTYCLPILLTGLVGFAIVRRTQRLAVGILLMAIVAFYLALGPSVKIDAVKPLALQQSLPAELSALMPAEGTLPTGSAWISQHIPGFDAMRASYRWAALGVFALWWLTVLALTRVNHQRTFWATLGLYGLIAFYLPDVGLQWQRAVLNREMYTDLNQKMAIPLAQQLRPNELVAFIPYGNDFLVNHLASFAGVRTYNIGGNKNLAMAQARWPAEMKEYFDGTSGVRADQVMRFLLEGHADAVVIPYVDTLSAAHLWPCPPLSPAVLTELDRQAARRNVTMCPIPYRTSLSGIIAQMQGIDALEVSDQPYFAVIRLKEAALKHPASVNRRMIAASQYPIQFGGALANAAFLMRSGWYPLEQDRVWSKPQASLELPVPPDCKRVGCRMIVRYNTFGATMDHPVDVIIADPAREAGAHTRTHHSDDAAEVAIAINPGNDVQMFDVRVTGARTPHELNVGADDRLLGIALQSVRVEPALPGG